MADSFILEKVFRTLTGLKFEPLSLSLIVCQQGKQMEFFHCQEKFL